MYTMHKLHNDNSCCCISSTVCKLLVPSSKGFPNSTTATCRFTSFEITPTSQQQQALLKHSLYSDRLLALSASPLLVT